MADQKKEPEKEMTVMDPCDFSPRWRHIMAPRRDRRHQLGRDEDEDLPPYNFEGLNMAN